MVVIHPDRFLLPELGEELGLYAERKLRERKVDVLKGVRVASYDGSVVTLTDGTSIPASTLIWTAGVKPSAVIASLPCEKERGRVRVNEYLAVPGVSGLWAAGDCAAVPDVTTGTLCPPTAQHGLRQGGRGEGGVGDIRRASCYAVMAGLVPAIHVLRHTRE